MKDAWFLDLEWAEKTGQRKQNRDTDLHSSLSRHPEWEINDHYFAI